ncbi:MAG: glucose-6-phosphate isomerase, partial [Duncaniella sp.]|nr:glucose-6-phosphate isomerase [Duncaniella sp.]
MKTINLDIKHALSTVSRADIAALEPKATEALDKVISATGAGNDFLGWVNLPTETTEALLDDIIACADHLRATCDTVVAIGIGGSYLGAKAVIEALSDSFAAYRPAVQGEPKVIFAGQNIGEDYLYELQDYLKDKRFGIIVISKSGTTTEPAIAFRLLKEQLERQLGVDEARSRLVAITD